MTLRESKLRLRERIVTERDALTAAIRADASKAIARAIAALGSYARARVVLLTLPLRNEWDATLLLDDALAAGKVVVLPRVDATARMLRLHRIDDRVRDVEPGHLGIPEPLRSCAAVASAEIDWVLVPGVAFDAAGRRMGYGGGYYDRLLPTLDPHAPRVAGAFEMQVVAAIPTAPHDLRVDAVVTEHRRLDTRRQDT